MWRRTSRPGLVDEGWKIASDRRQNLQQTSLFCSHAASDRKNLRPFLFPDVHRFNDPWFFCFAVLCVKAGGRWVFFRKDGGRRYAMGEDVLVWCYCALRLASLWIGRKTFEWVTFYLCFQISFPCILVSTIDGDRGLKCQICGFLSACSQPTSCWRCLIFNWRMQNSTQGYESQKLSSLRSSWSSSSWTCSATGAKLHVHFFRARARAFVAMTVINDCHKIQDVIKNLKLE